MAVMRNSQQGGPAPMTQRGINLPSERQARPDVERHRAQQDRASDLDPVMGPRYVRGPNASDVQVLQQMLQSGAQVMQTKIDMDRQEAYLSGSAAAASGEVESGLQTSPLTSSWTTAGFRDTTARLALASSEAQLMREMPQLREKSPDVFAATLAQRRSQLMPQLQGTSIPARQSLMAQIATSDRAAIVRHGQEHGQFILDQKSQAIQTGISTRAKLLDASKGTPSYASEVTAYVAAAYGSTFGDASLPPELQQRLFGDTLQHALTSGNLAVYEQAISVPLPLPDGSTRAPIHQLPLERQTQLGSQYRQALKYAGERLSLQEVDQLATLKAQFSDPQNQDLPPMEQVQGLYRRHYESGAWSDEKYVSEMSAAYRAYYAKDKAQTAAAAWSSGNSGLMLSRDITPEEGAKAHVKNLLANGATPAEVVSSLVAMGTAGREGALKVLGSTVSQAYKHLGVREEIDPTDAAVIAQVSQAVDHFEAIGNKAAVAELYSGMPDDAREVAFLYRAALGLEKDPQRAAVIARQRWLERQALTPAQRGANVAANAKNNRDYTEGMEARGALGRLYDSTLGRLFPTSAGQLLPRGEMWGQHPVVDEQVAIMRMEMENEMDYLAGVNPSQPLEARAEEATANLLARTIPTAHGNVYLPRGSSIQSLFKVAQSDTTPDRVGKAIDRLVENTGAEFDRALVQVGPTGQLMLDFYNADGERLPSSMQVEPASVGGVLDRLAEEEAERGRQMYSKGLKQQGVRYDGQNSAGVEPQVAAAIRGNLVKNEGVKMKVYKDTKGVLTVGVGVSERNTYWPQGLKVGDEITPEQASVLFEQASNEALNVAWTFQQRAGLKGPAWTTLLAEMAYQSGDVSKQEQVLRMAHAVVENNGAAAHEALRKTNAFQASGADRKSHYSFLLDNILRTKR